MFYLLLWFTLLLFSMSVGHKQASPHWCISIKHGRLSLKFVCRVSCWVLNLKFGWLRRQVFSLFNPSDRNVGFVAISTGNCRYLQRSSIIFSFVHRHQSSIYRPLASDSPLNTSLCYGLQFCLYRQYGAAQSVFHILFSIESVFLSMVS